MRCCCGALVLQSRPQTISSRAFVRRPHQKPVGRGQKVRLGNLAASQEVGIPRTNIRELFAAGMLMKILVWLSTRSASFATDCRWSYGSLSNAEIVVAEVVGVCRRVRWIVNNATKAHETQKPGCQERLIGQVYEARHPSGLPRSSRFAVSVRYGASVPAVPNAHR